MSAARALPEGRSGQALALALLAIAIAAVWLGAVSPALTWFENRQVLLAARQMEIAHSEMLRASLPALRAEVAGSAGLNRPQILLAGDSDAIAGANLQSALTDLASQAGISLDSAEMAAVEPIGALRQVDVDVSVTATLPALAEFLNAIDTAQPRMIVDNLNIVAAAQPDPRQEISLQANFSVSAFRAGDGP